MNKSKLLKIIIASILVTIPIINKHIADIKNVLKSVLYLDGANNVIILKYLKNSAFSPTLDIIWKSMNNIQSPASAQREIDVEEKLTELKKHIPKKESHKP